jgi:hypothetical protein
MHRQPTRAAIDFAQGPYFDPRTSASNDLFQFLELVNIFPRHRHSPDLNRMHSTDSIAHDDVGQATRSRHRVPRSNLSSRRNRGETSTAYAVHTRTATWRPPMKFLIDRLFGELDRMFDDPWVLVWQLDKF